MKYLLKKDKLLVVGAKRATIKRTKHNKEIVAEIITLCDSFDHKASAEDKETLVQSIIDLCNPKRKIAHKSDNRFHTDEDGSLYLTGIDTPLDSMLAEKILYFLEEGLPIASLINFAKNVFLNPSLEATQGLFRFLEHNGHPLTKHGYFVAYKSVSIKKKYDVETGDAIQDGYYAYNEDTGEKVFAVSEATLFTDNYTKKMKINVGEVVTLPREACEHNPSKTCSAGLHVGSWEYVGGDAFSKGGFGGSDTVILEVLVNPMDVVSVPSDYNNTKMRCCRYFVSGIVTRENQSMFDENDFHGHIASDLAEMIPNYEEEIKAKKAELATLLDRAGN